MSPLGNTPQTEKMSVPADTNSAIVDSNKQEILQDAAVVDVNKQRTDNVAVSLESLPADVGESLSEEQLQRLLAEKKAERLRKKQVLTVAMERGAVAHRLHVPLPQGVHGEWVRNDPLEVERLRSLGFEIDSKYATARSLTSDGTGAPMVGDVIFMTCSQDNYDIIQEIRNEQSIAKHSPKKKQSEEQQFIEQTKRDTGGIVPTFSTGESREAKKHDIAKALDIVK